MLRAVRDFVQERGDGQLPVSGVIPDMFSDSQRYIQLLTVYRKKATEDFEWVYKRVQDLLERVGKPTESISESAVRLFCKESFHLRLVRTGSSLADEFEGRSPHVADIARHMEERPDSPALYYYALRGADRFRAEFNAVPGADDELVEPDIGKLKTCCAKVLAESGLGPAINMRDDFVHEVCRCGGAELHSVAAMMGASAAQECVKVITGQYVPVDNLFVYDGMSSETLMLTV